MAASDPDQSSERAHARQVRAGPDASIALLSARELEWRMDEEINRAGRHGGSLGCLLISLEDLDELAAAHGRELPAQALALAGPALQAELRRFDRVGHASERELAVILPGADGPRCETVARRLLERMRAIKVEAGGVRRALRVSVGLATWHGDLDAPQLIGQARLAAQRERNGFGNGVAAER